MEKFVREKIKEEFQDCIDNTLERIQEAKGTYKPFHSRLLNQEVIVASLFERSFSTSFGQRVIEVISRIIASNVSGTNKTENQKKTCIKISRKTLNSINDHIQSLRENRLKRIPEWDVDIKSIRISPQKIVEERIISDLWFSGHGREYFFSIKTVKPNIDQTAKAKRDMLLLKMANKNFYPFFALPYNPYGEERKEYAHHPPFKIFNMIQDKVVLIGKEYWDTIGGSGTYQEILSIADNVGKRTKNLLKKTRILK